MTLVESLRRLWRLVADAADHLSIASSIITIVTAIGPACFIAVSAAGGIFIFNSSAKVDPLTDSESARPSNTVVAPLGENTAPRMTWPNLTLLEAQEADDDARRDYAAAVKVARELLVLGDPQGMFQLAHLYEHGLGVPRNIDNAITLYLMAAERGHVPAMEVLGVLYFKQSNCSEAVKWETSAAELGVVTAMYNLGMLNLYGCGAAVPRNEEKALVWFRVAADKGSYYAQKHLDKLDR